MRLRMARARRRCPFLSSRRPGSHVKLSESIVVELENWLLWLSYSLESGRDGPGMCDEENGFVRGRGININHIESFEGCLFFPKIFPRSIKL